MDDASGAYAYFIDSDIPSRSAEDTSFMYRWSGSLVEQNYPDSLLNDSVFYYSYVYGNEPVLPRLMLRVEDSLSGCVGNATYNILKIDVENDNVCEKDVATYHVYYLPDEYKDSLRAEYKKTPLDDWEYVRAKRDEGVMLYHIYQAYWANAGDYIVDVDLDESVEIPYTLIIGANVEQKVVSYPDVNIKGPIDVCVGSEKDYQVHSSADDGTITWSLSSSKIEAKNELTVLDLDGSNVSVFWGTAGVDTLSAIVDNGCPGTDVKYVTVHDNPVASFAYAPVSDIYVGAEVVFSNKSVPAENESELNFYWDFVGEDIFVSEQENPTYVYQDLGTYPAQLIVEDRKWGCLDTAIVEVAVTANPQCQLNYPNTIIPEHENPEVRSFASDDDRIGVLQEGYSLKIFNRWGALLWETTDLLERWDGTYQGEYVKQDDYIFHSTYKCENGKVVTQNGDVTVLR